MTRPIGATTSSPYNVVGKTITQLIADLKSGATTSEQITQAYLDRIAAYDRGPFGLNSMITLAPDALAQAKAADVARKAGDTRPLLGIPIVAKDLMSTKDMPTTGGSRVFEGFQSTTDAWQIIKVKEAGAIVMGKANLAEYANDGHFSPSAYGQVWNAYDPSKSPIGSSGGTATAVASSFAAAGFGTQTGDSLWGPSSAVSPRVAARHRRHAVLRRHDAADLHPGLRRAGSASRSRTSRCCSTRPRSTTRPTSSMTCPTATGPRTGPPAWTPTRSRARSSACR